VARCRLTGWNLGSEKDEVAGGTEGIVNSAVNE